MPSISREGNRAYPSIPEITEDPYTHTIALQAVKEALATHERRDRAVSDSFIRFGELVDLGIIDNEGDYVLDIPDEVFNSPVVGFYGTTPIAQQTAVPVTIGAVHAALVALGLIT